jgi:hypothetical protein
MGLIIEKYPIYEKTATIKTYINIRDINEDKSNNLYTLHAIANVKIKGHEDTSYKICVDTIPLFISSPKVYINNWSFLYEELKRILKEKKIVYIDC